MKNHLRSGVAMLAVLALPFAAVAQEATPAAAPAAVTASAGVAVKMGTTVPLKLNTELNSKTTKTGERFELTVTSPVVSNGQVVIPAGAIATGEVTKVTKKGAFGRSGKIAARLLFVDVGGQRVPLTGEIDSAGKGGTAGTVAAAVMVGVFSAFVTGKSALMPVGYEVSGYTAGETTLPALGAALEATVAVAKPAA